jgi:1-acyl-sn-glycerol-3-phosphate acyltransferase
MGLKWFLSWIVIFPLLKLLTGVEIDGSIPKHGAAILACNHVSFLDPPAVGITACREVYFLAKPELFRLSKFFTWLITSYNALSIGGTEGLRKAIRLLKNGHAVVIFPEGTRIRTGVIESFNPGVGYLSISLGIPVIPVYIKNSNKKFISLMLRLNRLKVTFGQPLCPSAHKKKREDFEQFAAKIREEIINLQ